MDSKNILDEINNLKKQKIDLFTNEIRVNPIYIRLNQYPLDVRNENEQRFLDLIKKFDKIVNFYPAILDQYDEQNQNDTLKIAKKYLREIEQYIKILF